MLPFRMPTIPELLHSVKLAEFWYGVIVASVILVAYGIWHSSGIETRNDQNLKIIKNNEKESLARYSQKIFNLKSEIDQLSKKNIERKEDFVKLLESSNDYCKRQMHLINVLQRDHKLETKISVNYEYLSILEKVLIKMYNNAESCERATGLQ